MRGTVLDCNAGLHILPGHPLQVDVNLHALMTAANVAAQEISAHARCAAATAPLINPLAAIVDGNQLSCYDQLTDEVIERHFIPGFPMLLNNLEPLRKRRHLPAQCQLHQAGQLDSKPVFAQTFFDDSAISTVLANWFNMSSLRVPQFWFAPETCSYERYVSGDGGCALTPRNSLQGGPHA